MPIASLRARGRQGARLVLCLSAALVVVGFATSAAAADAPNEALLRLLQVLRDRGSISAQEYEDIRGLADPQAARAAATPAAPDLAAREAGQDKAIAEVQAAVAGTPAPVVSRALAGKWYERLSLRGYTQFRGSEVTSERGAVLEVPADRTVNPNESFAIRRGRLVLSGDVADHLSLYLQTDQSGNIGTGDFAVQLRDLYGDVWLDQEQDVPRAPRAVEGAVRLGQSPIEPEPGAARASRRDQQRRRRRTRSRRHGDVGVDDRAATVPRPRRPGLKGSATTAWRPSGSAGQGLNRPDQNGDPRVLARVSLSVQDRGRPVHRVRRPGLSRAFRRAHPGHHQRWGDLHTRRSPVTACSTHAWALTAIVYPQPVGVEAEWNFGEGPELSADLRSIGRGRSTAATCSSTTGRAMPPACGSRSRGGTTIDGARKFARNAPHTRSTNWTSAWSSPAGPKWRSPAFTRARSDGRAAARSRTI